MLKGARLVVILLFLAGFGMILLFMPKDFSKAMGDGFDISQVEQIQVTLVPVEGDETLTVTLNQGEEEYVDLITLLQEPTYSRTSSKSDEISLDYWVNILFSDGEIWPWSYDFQADKLKVPYVVFLGEDEISKGVVKVKDMVTGDQTEMTPEEAISAIGGKLAEMNGLTPIKEKG